MTANTSKTITLADHAEAWWFEQGNVVPPHNSPEWWSMYHRWVSFAFGDDARDQE